MPDRRRFLVMGLATTLFASPVQMLARAASQPAPATHPKNKPDADDTGSTGHILVVGDSLSAEYGLPQGTGWVAHIAQRLSRQEGKEYQIHNSSISGDTTSGGLSRLPADLARLRPDVVIIELGANDALRGLQLDMVRDNLAQMITLSQQAGAKVLLAGMQIPPNYGRRYADQFAGLFSDLADTHQTGLVPFLLDGFAARPEMFLDDGIHPNEDAQAIIAENVWPHLEPLLGD